MWYKNLIAWQKGMMLVKEVYLVTQKLPGEELFGLTNQLRRAAVSVPSNIAEGYNRHSDRELNHFLKIAKGSTAEVETQLLLCVELGYVTEQELQTSMNLIKEMFKMLTAMILKSEKGN
jgi:four helix bundle protein